MLDPVISSMLRLNRHRKKYVRQRLAQYDFVGVMHLILMHASHHPGTSQEEIAGFFGLDKTGVARDTRKLEERGYLVRRVNEQDRRQNCLFLTSEGEKLVSVIDGILNEYFELTSSGLSAVEWESLGALLHKMEVSLQ